MAPPSPDVRSRSVRTVLLVTLFRNFADSGSKLLVGTLSGSRAAHEVADRIERALTQARREIVDVVVELEPA
jgi:divalent metal cation (Fe/Co/Zn/Cd) transporter